MPSLSSERPTDNEGFWVRPLDVRSVLVSTIEILLMPEVPRRAPFGFCQSSRHRTVFAVLLYIQISGSVHLPDLL